MRLSWTLLMLHCLHFWQGQRNNMKPSWWLQAHTYSMWCHSFFGVMCPVHHQIEQIAQWLFPSVSYCAIWFLHDVMYPKGVCDETRGSGTASACPQMNTCISWQTHLLHQLFRLQPSRRTLRYTRHAQQAAECDRLQLRTSNMRWSTQTPT